MLIKANPCQFKIDFRCSINLRRWHLILFAISLCSCWIKAKRSLQMKHDAESKSNAYRLDARRKGLVAKKDA